MLSSAPPSYWGRGNPGGHYQGGSILLKKLLGPHIEDMMGL